MAAYRGTQGQDGQSNWINGENDPTLIGVIATTICDRSTFPSSTREFNSIKWKWGRVSCKPRNPRTSLAHQLIFHNSALRTWDVRYTTATGRRRKAGTTGKAKPWGALEESRDLTALSMVADASLWGLTKAAPSRSRGISSVAVHPTGNVIWALGRNGR